MTRGPTPGAGPGTRCVPLVTAVPRPAASLILVRDAAPDLEVLLVLRSPHSRFMPDVWVFPGGALEPGEDAREAAVRELREETGVGGLAPGGLVPFSRWVTPATLPIRFDTAFFLASAPADACARADGRECVDARWLRPTTALAEVALAFPTARHLEALGGFPSTAALLARARGPVQPGPATPG